MQISAYGEDSRRVLSEIRCSALLFDLDGVLIDSTPTVTRVWRKWALEHGFDPDEVVERVQGRPCADIVLASASNGLVLNLESSWVCVSGS